MKEEWRDIEGYNGLYQVSNLGRVRCVRILKPAFTEDGYLKVVLQDRRNIKTSTIHRLVAKSFLSTSQASKQTGISHRNIATCCRGERISAGGYKWKYKDG